jgi:hypothetical protein
MGVQEASRAGDTQGMALAAAPLGMGIRGARRGAGALFDAATGLPIKGADFTKASREALEEVARQPKGAGPLDLSTASQIPDVPQVPLERYVPPRGVSPRLQEALENPAVRRGVESSVKAGEKLGADKWYHTGPVRDAWIAELGPVEGPKAFGQYMDMVAATSPRSDVPTNIRNASRYYQHARSGEPLSASMPYPYGHVAQNLHRQNFETLMKPGPQALSSAAVPGYSGWDVLQNPKPASFSQNLQGNLEPGTMDTHAFRNIGMRTGDPRFLATSIQEVYKPGVDRSADSMVSRFGDIRGDRVVFRPQQLLSEGKLSMSEAKNIPSFWATMPNPNEYAAAEDFYRAIGKKRGMPTADAQAAAWAGGGELTGLGTVPTHTFPEMLNERVLYTSKMRNENPEDTLAKLIRGNAPLFGLAGTGLYGLGAISQDQQ